MNIISIQFCESNAGKRIFSFLGEIFDKIMIVIPIIIIIMGMIDFIKIIVSQKDDEMKKAQNLFIKRLIYGISIFFVPPLITFVIGLVGGNTLNPCMSCFIDSSNCSITNKTLIPNESLELNTSECKNSENKDLCCKEKNGPDDSNGIWIWNDDVGCKNTTASNPY